MTDKNLDQIALDAATAILPMYFEAIPGVQLKAKIQCAVREAINAALKETAELCEKPYRTPDGWGVTSGDQRCARLIVALTDK